MKTPSPPMPIKARPYNHQYNAFCFVCKLFGLLDNRIISNGAAVLMDMGTGKTITAGGLMMDSKVKEQILAIRDTALTNMFDIPRVTSLAKNMGYYDLVLFLQYNRAEYVSFIMYGDEE